MLVVMCSVVYSAVDIDVFEKVFYFRSCVINASVAGTMSEGGGDGPGEWVRFDELKDGAAFSSGSGSTSIGHGQRVSRNIA